MKQIFVLILLYTCTNVLFADGLPVDSKGNITEPHTIVDLNEEQIEELNICGTVTLTSEQWKQMRLIGKICPKRFDMVYPIYWDDCTCGSFMYAIRFSDTKIAILHRMIETDLNEEFEIAVGHDSDNLNLVIDNRGQFYFKSTLIPYKYLISTLKADGINNKATQKEKSIIISIPFGLTNNSLALKDRLAEVKKVAENSRWQVFY